MFTSDTDRQSRSRDNGQPEMPAPNELRKRLASGGPQKKSATVSAEKKKDLKSTVVVYLILSFAAIVVDNGYALFGHGVRSPYMTWMFLYPLIGGTLVYLLIELLASETGRASGFRLASNIYNSGIAALTAGSFLKGILAIAGADSPYTVAFFAVGWSFVAAGVVLYILKPLRRRTVDSD